MTISSHSVKSLTFYTENLLWMQKASLQEQEPSTSVMAAPAEAICSSPSACKRFYRIFKLILETSTYKEFAAIDLFGVGSSEIFE